jgi:hypothetical protein
VPHIVATENPSKDAARYLRHWASPDFVREHLSNAAPPLPSDRRRTKAKQAAFCIAQGLEYLESGAASSLLTKALPLFYAAENLSKATCIVREPSLTSADFRAHGLKSDLSKRYSIKNLQCSIYAKPSRDVWSHLFRECNADMLRLEQAHDGQAAAGDVRIEHKTKPLSGKRLLLGDVLRHLPELVDDIFYAGWGNPYVVHVSALDLSAFSGPPPRQVCTFVLRHGRNEATRRMILAREKDLLKGYAREQDLMDVVVFSATSEGLPGLTLPTMRHDVFGEQYMDFGPPRDELGEFCLYFVALFILSSVVRYDAEQWKRLTDDHPSEALLVDRFLDLTIRKLPNLVLNELHQQTFLFKFAR